MAYYYYGGSVKLHKRVVVVVDGSSGARDAVVWALTHVTGKGDILTLLQVVSPPPINCPRRRGAHPDRPSSSCTPKLVSALGALCKAWRPEVEVEALLVQGPRLDTVLAQVKKLHASVLVLPQRRPRSSGLRCCLFGGFNSDHDGTSFVDQCINRAECVALAVRRRSGGLGGYLISTRWHKDFWLLA